MKLRDITVDRWLNPNSPNLDLHRYDFKLFFLLIVEYSERRFIK